MYAGLPPDQRHAHPYHMYEEIRAQPEAVAEALASAREHGGDAVHLLARARRVFVIGCGTSFHAARLGAWFLQSFSRGRIGAYAVEAYEFVTYLPGVRPDDVVIAVSHSGATAMTLRGMERAHRGGAETVLVTGFPGSQAGGLARRVVPTGYEAERSWAHTVSYMAALAVLLSLANDLAEPEERLDLSPLPQVVADALALEDVVRRAAATAILAERDHEPLQIVAVGGGPNAVTAHEAVLKLQETSYARAMAVQLEEMLHGPLAACTENTMLLLIAPSGRSLDRAAGLVGAAQRIGMTPFVLSDEGAAARFAGSHVFVLPEVPEVISPLAAVVPLQLLSYFLATGRGLNPDLLRRDDERYRAARAEYD